MPNFRQSNKDCTEPSSCMSTWIILKGINGWGMCLCWLGPSPLYTHRYYPLDGLVRSSDRPCQSWSRPWWSAEKTIKLDYLEEVKLVTRFLKVNLRRDNYQYSLLDPGRPRQPDQPPDAKALALQPWLQTRRQACASPEAGGTRVSERKVRRALKLALLQPQHSSNKPVLRR